MKVAYCLFLACLVSIASANYWQIYKNYADSSCTGAQYQGVVVMVAGACTPKGCTQDAANTMYYTTECVDTSVGPDPTKGVTVQPGFASLTTYDGSTTCDVTNTQVIAKSGACLQAGGVQFKLTASCGSPGSVTRQFYAQDFTCANSPVSTNVMANTGFNKCIVVVNTPINATCVPVAPPVAPVAPVAAPVRSPNSPPVAVTPTTGPVAAPVKKNNAVALGVNVIAVLLVIVAAIQF